VLEHTRPTEYAIWVVAFLLYAYDAVRLLAPRELLLVEAAGGRLAPLIGDNPFTAGGRTLAFGPLHLPHRGAFLASWGRPWSAGAGLQATLDGVARLRGALGPVRVLAVLAALLLFVLGPALTLPFGPDAAVVGVAAGLYPTVVAAIVVLWWRRRRFGLAVRRTLWLSFEILVCPAFLPNLVRKLIAQQPLEADGAQVLLAAAAPDVRDEFLARLQARAEGLLEAGEPEAAGHDDLKRYLATLRGAG
jgi:hypothetical protein